MCVFVGFGCVSAGGCVRWGGGVEWGLLRHFPLLCEPTRETD